MIKILIADDHTIVRKGLKQILQETSGMVVTGEAGTGQETLEKIWKNNYNVLLLDISMPDRNGLDILKDINHAKPNLPVLVLSMHPEEQYAKRVLRAGASGYLTKESAPEELIRAILKIHGGGKYVSESLAETLAFDLKQDVKKPLHETLSDREYQVMCLIAKGRSLKDIADDLFLSSKTISTYRARIMEKMDMKTNSEVIRYAIKKRLVE